MAKIETVFCKRVPLKREEILNPSGAFWSGLQPAATSLLPTPLGRQPSEYLKYTQDPQKVGKVKNVNIKAAHNGTDIFFMLQWDDDTLTTKPTAEAPFIDAVGVIIPFKNDAPHNIIVTMGSEAYKVNVWYWRSDEPDKPRNVWAQGIGTTVTTKQSFVFSRGKWENNKWSVVIGRKMSLPEQKDDAVQLTPNMKTLLSFGVWDGGNKERGGIKAFCPCEIHLIIE
ncbi:MAG TPA: ethylbenzene dehydrogenase-related protein [bacterium]